MFLAQLNNVLSKIMSTNPEREAAVRRMVPINRLPAENQAALVTASEFQTVFDGQVVYFQGHQDDFIHYLVDGTVELLWNGKVVTRLSSDSKAACRALDKPGRKRHTVRAVSNCVVLRIPRAAYDAQLEEANFLSGPRQLEVSEIATEKSSNWMIKMLQSELFDRLPATNIQKIFGRMERVTVSANEVVVSQGGPGDYYFVIERGYCEVSRQVNGGKEIHLADLIPGDAFGEAAIIAGNTRDAAVTMLCDGTLMRLSYDDFNELIRAPLLHAVSPETAIAAVDDGAEWLDIRYPEEYVKTGLRCSLNLPYNVLRLQAKRLDKSKKYIVCCDDTTQSAVGAFLLIERGIDVDYLDETISNLVAAHPSVLTTHVTQIHAAGRVVAFPGTGRAMNTNAQSSPSQREESAMDERQSDENKLENTIEKIDRLYSQKEWEAEKAARVPIEDYAQTVTGQRLADLINEIDEKRSGLTSAERSNDEPAVPASRLSLDELINIAPDDSELSRADTAGVLLVDTHAPMPLAQDDSLNDGLFDDDDDITQIIRDFEYRMRDYVENVAHKRAAEVEARYQDKLKRLRKAAAIEVRKRQDLSRRRYEQLYKKKELGLRAHYKKLMALANKISEQKAQLQQAKRQFDEKLAAANAVYKQVEDLRKTLRQHIGDLPPGPESDKRRSA